MPVHRPNADSRRDATVRAALSVGTRTRRQVTLALPSSSLPKRPPPACPEARARSSCRLERPAPNAENRRESLTPQRPLRWRSGTRSGLRVTYRRRARRWRGRGDGSRGRSRRSPLTRCGCGTWSGTSSRSPGAASDPTCWTSSRCRSVDLRVAVGGVSVIGLRGLSARRVPSAKWALKSDDEAADKAIVPPSSLPSPSPSAPLETGAQPLLPELLQSGLLLGLSVGVLGLAVIAAHLLTALQ